MSSDAEKEYLRNKYQTNMQIKDHVKEKSMWGGSTQYAINNQLVCCAPDYRIKLVEVWFTYVWYKTFDEAIVNAIDRCIEAGARTIKVTFNGYIFTIENDGPGFEIVEHPDKPGLYLPEYLITTLLAGSQLKKSTTNISGGTNGIGLKILCIYSNRLRIYTVDPKRMKLYTQLFSEGEAAGPPEIVDLAHHPFGYKIPELNRMVTADKPFTLFIYEPKLSLLKMPDQFTQQNCQIYILMMRARLMQAAAYLNSSILNQRRQNGHLDPSYLCKVYFNEELLPIKSLEDYVKFHNLSAYDISTTEFTDSGSIIIQKKAEVLQNKIITISSTLAHHSFPWDICVTIGASANVESFSVIDGVVVLGTSQPDYFKYFRDKIIDEVMSFYEDKIKSNYSDDEEGKTCRALIRSFLRSTMAIYLSGAVNDPQWVGQEKSSIKLSSTYFKSYSIPKEFLREIAEKSKDLVEYALTKHNGIQIKKILKKTLGKVPKEFMPAKYVNKKGLKYHLDLLVSEGGSASGLLESMLEILGHDTIAIYDLRGVPMNARKQIQNLKDAYGNRIKSGMRLTRDHMTKELASNEILQGLVTVMGLDYDKDYSTNEQLDSLNYWIVGAVDQDFDGTGKIFPLLQNFIELFFPNVYKAGRVSVRFD